MQAKVRVITNRSPQQGLSPCEINADGAMFLQIPSNDRDFPALVCAWKKAAGRNPFLPQFHGLI